MLIFTHVKLKKNIMNIDDIKRLVAQGESETLEFKKSIANLKSASEALCGFLNSKGGVVLIGVSDNKKIVGQEVNDKIQLEIANTLKKFEPTANINVEYVDFENDKKIIVFIAHPDSRSIPYTFEGRPYEKNQSSKGAMSQSRYQQLLLQRNMNPVSWESQLAIGISIDDLDEKEILSALKDITQKKRLESGLKSDNILDILTRLKLIEAGQIINAAVVLFAKEIPGNYMQCVIRMARFRGTKKGDFIDSRHVFGNAFQLLKEAQTFIARNTAISSRFEKGNMARIDEPEYPSDAIREALINAICHREYETHGGAITITIYDDRMEIASTGILPSGITMDELRKTHTSHPRNTRITNVFFRRGFIESMGIGTQEIIESCSEAKMKEPEFYEQAGCFVVRLWSRHEYAVIDDSHLSERQRRILTILKNNPLSPKELLSLLGEEITDRTLRSDLQSLKKVGLTYSQGEGRQTQWFAAKNPEINPETRK